MFLENINFLIVQTRLSNSHYEELITVLPKLNKNSLKTCDYRSITLQNCEDRLYLK